MPKEKREHAIVQLAAEISVPGHFAQSLEEGQ
jgi:hypothetical protein